MLFQFTDAAALIDSQIIFFIKNPICIFVFQFITAYYSNENKIKILFSKYSPANSYQNTFSF